MRTLVRHLDRAGELLRLAVNAPRFDAAPFERVREQLSAQIRHEANDPGSLSSRAWRQRVFAGHPYAQPSNGTLETLAAVTRDDLPALAAKLITRAALAIAVVGAIDEKHAAQLVDRAFADLSPSTGGSKSRRRPSPGSAKPKWSISTCRNRPSASAGPPCRETTTTI